MPERSWAVKLFAGIITACIILICFYVPRRPGMEEAGVFNAAYTYAHSGRMAFPIYGIDLANSFGIHPHLHYAILGLLIRFGMSLYMAEAWIISAISLIAISLIVASRFPDTVKLGFLFGLYGSVVLAVMYLPDHAVSVRPELHVSIAWLAGLVALEDGRLRGWEISKLCLGVLLICYAAAMQNYALLAPAGLGFYAILLIRTVPRREAFKKIALCAVAACAVAIPFVLLYVYPNWAMIRANMEWGTTQSAPLLSKLATYFNIYDVEILPNYRTNLFSSLFAMGPILGAVSLRIPLLLATLGLLLVWRPTRGMALAFLPVPLLVIVTIPKAHYFISEQMIYLSAFWAVVLTACDIASRRFARPFKWAVVPFLSTVCCAGVFLGSPPLREIHTVARTPLHEMDVARAAARQILGPDARVASRHLGWYITGGQEWYRLERDLTEPVKLDHFDPKSYAAQFDAIADYSIFSWQTQSGVTPTAMYESGAVQLKGFFLPQRMPNLGFVLFQATKRGSAMGYCLRDDRLQRFHEDQSGPVVLVMVRGPRDRPSDPFSSLIFSPNLLDIPAYPPTEAISAHIVARETYEAKIRTLPAQLKVVDTIFGQLSPVDAYALVQSSRAADRPIRFLQTPQETALREFLARPGHTVVRADECAIEEGRPARLERPISSGFYAPGFEAANAFAGKGPTWGSEKLGPKTKLVSYIGADFGADHAIALRAIGLKHTADPNSSIESAILMSASNGYDWQPRAELALNTDGALHRYCIPSVGAFRFWKLIAADNPKYNYAWQIASLMFYE